MSEEKLLEAISKLDISLTSETAEKIAEMYLHFKYIEMGVAIFLTTVIGYVFYRIIKHISEN